MTEYVTRGAYARNRPVVVVSDLSRLAGPSQGTVRLPPRLYWGPNPEFDVDDDDRRRWLYSIVLSEALDDADICDFIDRRLLEKSWRSMALPDRVRKQWETRFPGLVS